MEKEKINLTGEQETLLITLFAKAQEKNPIFFDPMAKEILECIDYDFRKLNVPAKTVMLVAQRAKKLDDTIRDFLEDHPDGVIIHPGCGLDSRFWRVDNGSVRWFDLDLPDVAVLRRKFFPPSERYSLIASSVTDPGWIRQVDACGKPVLVAAEGLLMYLSESDVQTLFLRLQEAFPGCRLIADVFSILAARSAWRHASLKSTGANPCWGVDEPQTIEKWAEGIRVIEEWFFSKDPMTRHLSVGYQIAYRLAGLFQAANRAHRILYLQL